MTRPKKDTARRWKTEALSVASTPSEIFCAQDIRSKASYFDDRSLVFHCDAAQAAAWLVEAGLQVDCIVTSPPFYGQRDYEADGQIGLEDNPQDYIDRLVGIFNAFIPVLKKTGSLWVNLGDTYWSGRGQHRSGEKKQSARRFGLRPQDKRRKGPWTKAKQLLLIPHRFAIAMQESWWTVRNDYVWLKPNPIPDQVRDRCSMSHEYVFHFVRERFYYRVLGFDQPSFAGEDEEGAWKASSASCGLSKTRRQTPMTIGPCRFSSAVKASPSRCLTKSASSCPSLNLSAGAQNQPPMGA